MRLFFYIVSLFISCLPLNAHALEKEVISSPSGKLEITFIGHGTLMMSFKGKVVYVDPVTKYGDFETLPDADLILITHEHPDHLDPVAINQVRQDGKTVVIVNEASRDILPGALAMRNGTRRTAHGIKVEAVPAYNLVNKNFDGKPFHPKGRDNGYLIAFGKLRVYVAGDTENIPEMEKLGKIDVAFLPVNLPYTMSTDMAADAALKVKPRILYPYHTGSTDLTKLVNRLKDSGIDVRVRPMN